MKNFAYILIGTLLIGVGGYSYYHYIYLPAEEQRAREEQIRIEKEAVVEAERLRQEAVVEAERLRKEAAAEAERVREEMLSNAANACVELNNTMVGVSGPSERIKILKSYGFEPVKAEIVNSTLNEMNEMSNEIQRWNDWGCSEIREVKDAISCIRENTPSCEEIYIKAYDGISIEDELIAGYLNGCEAKRMAESCRKLNEQLEELRRLQRQLR